MRRRSTTVPSESARPEQEHLRNRRRRGVAKAALATVRKEQLDGNGPSREGVLSDGDERVASVQCLSQIRTVTHRKVIPGGARQVGGGEPTHRPAAVAERSAGKAKFLSTKRPFRSGDENRSI